MIENATIYVDGKPYPTRIHEHGEEGGVQTGYLEGTNAVLTALKKASPARLPIYVNGVLEETYVGVKWGDVCDCTDDHEIIHLDWEYSEGPNRKFSIELEVTSKSNYYDLEREIGDEIRGLIDIHKFRHGCVVEVPY